MSSPLTPVPACPWFLAVIAEDKSSKVAGAQLTYYIDCGLIKDHDDDHKAANGKTWSDKEGRKR